MVAKYPYVAREWDRGEADCQKNNSPKDRRFTPPRTYGDIAGEISRIRRFGHSTTNHHSATKTRC